MRENGEEVGKMGKLKLERYKIKSAGLKKQVQRISLR